MKLFRNLRGKLLNIAIGSAVLGGWVYGAIKVYSKLFGWDYSNSYRDKSLTMFVMACVVAPLWEELAFRHLPLTMAKKLKLDPMHVLMMSSIIFGWGHGGPTGIMLQGVGGFILGYVYLKNGYSYWSSVFMHFLWNYIVIFVV